MEMISMENNFLNLIFQEDGTLQFLGELLVFNIRAVFLLAFCLLLLRFIKMSASTRHIILATALISTALLPFYTKIFPPVNIIFDPSKDSSSLVDQSVMKFVELADVFSIDENKNKLYMNMVSDSELIEQKKEAGMREGFDQVGSVKGPQSEWHFTGQLNWSYVLISIYFAGVIFLLLRIVWSNFIVFLAVVRAAPYVHGSWQKTVNKSCFNFWIRKPVEVRASRAVMSPVTWGFFNPVILIPEDAVGWSEELIKSTVLHELAHIKRADWLVKQVVRCVCTIYWFNPYIWRVFNKMINNLETAADDMALSAGLNKASYASDLVSVVEKLRQPRSLSFSAVGMASVRNELSQRIEFILNPKSSHAQTSISGFLFSVCLMLGVIVPLASFQPNFQQKIVAMEVVENTLRGNGEVFVNDHFVNSDSKTAKFDYVTNEFIQMQNELLVREYSKILAGITVREKNTRGKLREVEKTIDLPAKSVVAITVETIKHFSDSQLSKDNSKIMAGTAEAKKSLVKSSDVNFDEKGSLAGFSLEPGQRGEKSSVIESTKMSAQNIAKQSNQKESKQKKSRQKGSRQELLTNDYELDGGRIESDLHAAKNLLVAFLQRGEFEAGRSSALKPRRIIKPKYPESARRRGIEGEVVVSYQVNSAGEIVNPVIVEASPEGVFDRSVIKALSRSSYHVPLSASEASTQSDGDGINTVNQVQELYKFVLDA